MVSTTYMCIKWCKKGFWKVCTCFCTWYTTTKF